MSNLITYGEVIRYARVSDHVPSCDIANICIWEENEFRRCLGQGFYDILKAELEDYSNVAKWIDGSYDATDKVSYEGVVCIANVNTSDSPENKVDWSLAPKFTTAAYEQFWCKYLAPYLSNVIMKASLPRMHSYVTAIGIQKRNARDSEAVNEKEYAILQRSYENEIEVIYNLMTDFVANDNSGLFDEFGIKKDICGKCKVERSGCKCNKSRGRYYFGKTENTIFDEHGYSEHY